MNRKDENRFKNQNREFDIEGRRGLLSQQKFHEEAYNKIIRALHSYLSRENLTMENFDHFDVAKEV